MATYTKNYNFVKPELTDDADIRVINENFDKLDNIVFTSGEVANHIGDHNAHADIFAKYLPLDGGSMTGELNTLATTANLGYTTFSSNVYQKAGVYRFSDDITGTIQNGYGKQYGARLKMYSPNATNNASAIDLDSINKDDTTKFTRMRVTPSGITISRGAGNTNYFDLIAPKFSATNITQYNNEQSDFIKSYYGNCTIGFNDENKSNEAYAQIKVFDNVVKVTGDGVYYNDLQSMFVAEFAETTGTLSAVGYDTISYFRANYVCRTTKYSNGLLVNDYVITRVNEGYQYTDVDTYYVVTFPTPFKDANYTCSCGTVYMAYDSNWYGGGDVGAYKSTATGIKLHVPAYKYTTYSFRGRWK